MTKLQYLDMKNDELKSELMEKSEGHSKLSTFAYLYGLTIIGILSLTAKTIAKILLYVEIAITKEALEFATDSKSHIYSFNDED